VSAAKVLVVDDFTPFRQVVCTTLEQNAGFQVIGQASDGLEAVQKAAELQPDLVLLDINLPKLNGMEVAKRLRKLGCGAKILVVSGESSGDFVREAVRAGAVGYVHKRHLGSELLAAMQAVLGGSRFFGRDLEDYESSEDTDGHTLSRHEVQFYSDDRVIVKSFARSISAALKVGEAAIAVVTKSHWDSLLESLRAEGLDIDDAIRKGTYIWVDARESLSTIMVNGMPDGVLFLDGLSRLVESASNAARRENARVAICGERVGLLWAQGQVEAAIRLEQLCNMLRETGRVNFFCAYGFSLDAQTDEDAFGSICAEHSAVYSG
jgi:DNA-binding NarL/FixJ family response regulator